MFEKKYNDAKKHKEEHASCGGEPYKSADDLFELLKNNSSENILEIGTAVGFTTYVLARTMPNANIDSIEMHAEHIEIAKENLKKWGEEKIGESRINLEKINFICSDARDILHRLEAYKYDIIFFDGYGPKLEFLKEYERIMKIGGLLISANSHLKSAEQEYFEELNTNKTWEFVAEFADTRVYKKVAR
jgi:predicted O-methyltransferase YrrM